MEKYLNFLRNPYKGLLIVRTHDYGRVTNRIQKAIQAYNKEAEIPYKAIGYSPGKASFEGADLRKDEVIKAIRDGLPHVYVFRNFMPFEADEVVQFMEKYVLKNGAAVKIIVVDPEYKIPPAIRPYVDEIEDYFPAKNEVSNVDYAEGLTSVELKKATHDGNVEEYRREILKRAGGVLEVFTPHDVDRPIGLDNAIKAIVSAYKSGLGKGTLLLGVPGTGKTLIAKYLASKHTVVKFNVGAVYSKYVGETEARLRETFATLRLFGNCFVFIDEFEKAMAHGNGDSGVSRRVLGEILSWLQDRDSNNYVIATMNDITVLPPELVRPGRWDFIFSLLPPGRKVRHEIAKYYAKKYRVKEDPAMVEDPHVTPADIATLYRIAKILGGNVKEARRYVKFTKEVTPHFERVLETARRYGVPVYEEEAVEIEL